jgi:hypothetical protein|nr:MAG TPA: putative tail-component [Caudoviricetes sp.]
MITPQFTPDDIERMLQEKIAKYEEKIVRILRIVGEKCINEAREYGSYQDQTGNLRSSIGYVVLQDGKVIEKGGFKLTKSGGNGQKEGEAFINKVISQYPKGFVLVVVAGMKYASYVEARNYNVLTSAELLAEREVPKLLKALSQ